KTTRSLLGVSAAVGERRIADSSQKDNARHNSDENIMGGGAINESPYKYLSQFPNGFKTQSQISKSSRTALESPSL
ncbi:hypothetical protein, partial [Helicobacter cinaedi]